MKMDAFGNQITDDPNGPLEVPPVADPTPPAPQPDLAAPPDALADLSYEVQADGNILWEDGMVTTAAGDPIEEPPTAPLAAPSPAPAPAAVVAAPSPPPVAPAPVAPAPPPVAAAPVVPAYVPPPPNRPIYTTEGVHASIVTDDALDEIAELRLTDPREAERRALALQMRIQQGERRLAMHASAQFDQDMELFAQQAPSVRRFAGQINAIKQTLTPEQLQHPEAAVSIAKRVLFDAIGSDPLAYEEAVMRAIGGGKMGANPQAPSAAAPPPVRRAPDVIPAAARSAGPGSTRRPDPAKRRDNGLKGDDMAASYMRTHPGTSVEEAKAFSEEMRKQDQIRARSHQRD